MTYYSEKDVVAEKGNWIACKGIQTVPQRYAVKRKDNPTNKLVPTYPLINIELMFESDAKLLVSLLARLEKLAVSSLKQIRKESHALRAIETTEEIQTREALRLASVRSSPLNAPATTDDIKNKEALRLFGKQETELTALEHKALAKALANPPRTVRIVTPTP